MQWWGKLLPAVLILLAGCPPVPGPDTRAGRAGDPGLVQVKISSRPLPTYQVEMIAGFGLWPPKEEEDVAEVLAQARQDGVGRMIVDSGMTERWQAYEFSAPYLKIIAHAASQGKKRGMAQAFYFPGFELRREQRRKGVPPKQSLLQLARPWAQVTLGGRAFFKTRFAKQEFWNKDGDEVLWVCPNSPWRQQFIRRMEQAVRQGARDVFVDVPYFQMSGKQITCRCAHCLRRFKSDTGLTIPTEARPGEQTYHRWIWWRHQVLGRFFAELRNALRKIDPAARLVVEEYPAYLDQGTTFTGVDIGLSSEHEVDVFAHEYSAKQFDGEPYSLADRMELAAALALYRGLDGHRPSWVLSYAHDQAGSRVSAALHLLFDASFWETRAPEMSDTSVGRPWRRRLFSWYAKQRGWFGASRQLARVALLYSPACRDFARDHFITLRRVMFRLIEARVPFRVLSTRDLQQLNDYQELILPAVRCLHPDHAALLRKAPDTRLLAVGAPPARGPFCINKIDHRLKVKHLALDQLPLPGGRRLLKFSDGGQLLVNLLQRQGELQVRLANLHPGTTSTTVSLIPPRPVTAGSYLPLLGAAKTLVIQKAGKLVRFSVPVKDLTIVRLKVR